MLFSRVFYPSAGAALVLLSGLAGAGRADLVIDSAPGSNNNDQRSRISGSILAGTAVVFTTGASSVWDLDSISMYFSAGSTTAQPTYSGGTMKLHTYQVNGAAITAANFMGKSSTSTAFNSFNIAPSFDIAGLADLAAQTTYLLGMDARSSVTGSSFLKLNSINSGAPITPNGWVTSPGYSYSTVFGTSTPTVTAPDTAATPASTGFGFALIATAVPEPGTMRLESIAGAGGGPPGPGRGCPGAGRVPPRLKPCFFRTALRDGVAT